MICLNETILSLHSLTKTYKRSHLGFSKRSRGVVDVNLEVRSGEVFGLIGLNGSGKTTTIKLIIGLLFPTKGEVRVYDHRVPHAYAQQRIGYLPEVPYFYRNITPVEVLKLYGALSRVDPRKLPNRIDEVLHIVKMGHAAKRPMREFSKGMLQRIGLAQALIHDPEILILDEPVTGLDPLGLRQIRDILTELNKEGKTIFFSSHSISEVERMANRVGILVDGQLKHVWRSEEWRTSAGQLEEMFVKTLEASGTSLVV